MQVIRIIGDESEWWPAEECTALYPRDAQQGDHATAWQMPDLSLHDDDDVERATLYRVDPHEAFEDLDDANEILRSMFWDMAREMDMVQVYQSDPVMASEDFNNWTDGLCKDGAICDDTYNECSLED